MAICRSVFTALFCSAWPSAAWTAFKFVYKFAPEQDGPEILKQCSPISKTQRPKISVPAKRSPSAGADSDDQTASTVKPLKRKRKVKNTKKPKKSKPRPTSSEDEVDHSEVEDEKPLLEISGHLFLEMTTLVPVGRGRGKQPSTVTQSTQCDAFIFTNRNSFNDLVKMLAVAAQISAESLTLSQLHWKYEAPARGERKLVSNEVSFKVMMKSIEKKKRDAVVFFYLPKPIPCKEVCYMYLHLILLTTDSAFLDTQPPIISTNQNHTGLSEYDEVATGHPSGSESIKAQLIHDLFIFST